MSSSTSHHSPALDPRIHASLSDLRALAGPARRISLLPRQPSGSILNGRHTSRLRGRGLNFEELRSYLPGDDPRTIDWRVTARTGTPHVRVYTEERDRPSLLLVDQRVSMFFGTVYAMKSVIAAQAAAIAAHRLVAQGDRVGGLVFGDDQIREHRARRGSRGLNRMLTDIARASQALHAGLPEGTIDANKIIDRAARLSPSNGMVILFSDFNGLTEEAEPSIRKLAHRGDLILVQIRDPADRTLPRHRLSVSDGTLQADLDLTNPALRARIETSLQARLNTLNTWSAKYGIPLMRLYTDRSALPQMLEHFGHRGAK